MITSDVTDAFDTVGLTEILNSYFDGLHVFSRLADVQMATVRLTSLLWTLSAMFTYLLTFLQCVIPGKSCVAHVDATPRLHAEPVVCWTVVCKHNGQFRFIVGLWSANTTVILGLLLDCGLQTQRSVYVLVGQWSANTTVSLGLLLDCGLQIQRSV